LFSKLVMESNNAFGNDFAASPFSFELGWWRREDWKDKENSLNHLIGGEFEIERKKKEGIWNVIERREFLWERFRKLGFVRKCGNLRGFRWEFEWFNWRRIWDGMKERERIWNVIERSEFSWDGLNDLIVEGKWMCLNRPTIKFECCRSKYSIDCSQNEWWKVITLLEMILRRRRFHSNWVGEREKIERIKKTVWMI
jgi:hypothetical protein